MFIIGLVNTVINIMVILIFLRVVFSWIPNFNNGLTDIIYQITEPIMSPFRVIIPIGGARLDLSPIIVYMLLMVIRRVIFALILY